MSVIRPKYVHLFRDDVQRVGRDAAHLLAVVRHVTTDLPGEHNGRVLIDGDMWWSATYPEIAEAMGDISDQKVGRIVRKLEAEGELASRQPDVWSGNQTKAYRTADQPIFTSERHDSAASPVKRPASPVNGPASPVKRPGFTSEHSSSLTEELSEETEETDYRAPQAIARHGANTSRSLGPGPIYDGVPVDEAEYREAHHRREASKREELADPTSLAEAFQSILDRGRNAARERQ